MSQDGADQPYLRRRVGRRRLLQGSSAAALTFATWGMTGCDLTSPSRKPTPTPRIGRGGADLSRSRPKTDKMSGWSRHARLANAIGLGEDPDDEEMEQLIQQLIADHVNVFETDTVLSDWMSEEEFDAAMAGAARWNRAVHRVGLHVVWYYPSLEILTPRALDGPSFFKLHPDWAQMSLKGEPNVFIGGGDAVKMVFWVEPGVESLWLSPNGPWRDYYLEKVKKVAQSGADGLWPDVPLYYDVVHSWCDTSDWAQAAFRTDSGLEIPDDDDWTDPTWRRWIEWRHRNLNQWILDIAAAGRSVNPDFETFVETVTCDHYDATSMGLDGAYLRLAEGVTHAWEVDTVSDSHSMYYATQDDWICMISIYKYCRAASGQKPAWVFSKGWQEEDAAQVMAEVLAAGCNPYEVQVPGKTIGVGGTMRARWYAFVEAHTARIFDSTPLAAVVLYHSSACRDYVAPSEQKPPPSGVYTSTPLKEEWPKGVTHWWSSNPPDNCAEIQWLGEYRGAVKVLVHGHVPFNVLTSPTFRAEDLEGYKLLVLPNIEAVSDKEAAIMRAFVSGGGAIVLTGPNPTGLNEYGDARPEYALADALGFGKQGAAPASKENRFGSGQVYYFRDLLGRQYLKSGTAAARDTLVTAISRAVPPFVTTDANHSVHLEATTIDGETILQFTNFIGVRGMQGFVVTPTSFTVSVDVPADKAVNSVAIGSPDAPTPALEPLAFDVVDEKVRFEVAVRQYSMVVIGWR